MSGKTLGRQIIIFKLKIETHSKLPSVVTLILHDAAAATEDRHFLASEEVVQSLQVISHPRTTRASLIFSLAYLPKARSFSVFPLDISFVSVSN